MGTNGPSAGKKRCLAGTSGEERFWNSWRSWRSDPLSPATKIGIDNVLAPCYYDSTSRTQPGVKARKAPPRASRGRGGAILPAALKGEARKQKARGVYHGDCHFEGVL